MNEESAYLVRFPGAVVALRATRIKQAIDHVSGPGRTRTCNQTVMSGWADATWKYLGASILQAGPLCA